MKLQTALVKIAARKDAGAKSKILGTLGLLGAGGAAATAGYNAFRDDPPATVGERVGNAAGDLKSRMMAFVQSPQGLATLAGLGLIGGYGLSKALSPSKPQPAPYRPQLPTRPGMSQTIPINIHTVFNPGGMQTHKYGSDKTEKVAVIGGLLGKSLGAVSRFAGRGTGYLRGKAVNRAYKSMPSADVTALLNAQRAANQKAGGLGWLMAPVQTLGSRMSRRGRLGWITEQAKGNTKAWQSMAGHLPKGQASRLQRQAGRFGKAVSGRSPGLASGLAAGALIYDPIIDPYVWDPIMGSSADEPMGWDEYQKARVAQHEADNAPFLTRLARGYEGLMAGLGGKIGDNAVGNWVSNNPYVAGGAGLAGAAGLGYGLYRLASGGQSQPQYGYY